MMLVWTSNHKDNMSGLDKFMITLDIFYLKNYTTETLYKLQNTFNSSL